jgi:hypothetical protein
MLGHDRRRAGILGGVGREREFPLPFREKALPGIGRYQTVQVFLDHAGEGDFASARPEFPLFDGGLFDVERELGFHTWKQVSYVGGVKRSQAGRCARWPHRRASGWLDAFGLCFNVLPVIPRIAWATAAFDWPHRDPSDRHVLATALVHGLPLMTIDPVIAVFAPRVGVNIVW